MKGRRANNSKGFRPGKSADGLHRFGRLL